MRIIPLIYIGVAAGSSVSAGDSCSQLCMSDPVCVANGKGSWCKESNHAGVRVCQQYYFTSECKSLGCMVHMRATDNQKFPVTCEDANELVALVRVHGVRVITEGTSFLGFRFRQGHSAHTIDGRLTPVTERLTTGLGHVDAVPGQVSRAGMVPPPPPPPPPMPTLWGSSLIPERPVARPVQRDVRRSEGMMDELRTRLVRVRAAIPDHVSDQQAAEIALTVHRTLPEQRRSVPREVNRGPTNPGAIVSVGTLLNRRRTLRSTGRSSEWGNATEEIIVESTIPQRDQTPAPAHARPFVAAPARLIPRMELSPQLLMNRMAGLRRTTLTNVTEAPTQLPSPGTEASVTGMQASVQGLIDRRISEDGPHEDDEESDDRSD